MHNPIFLLKGILLPGNFLLGDYAWSEEMRLETATLICQPPSAGELTITLEVDGELTNKSFVVGPASLPEVRQTLSLGVKVLAGQTVRWRAVSFTGDTEQAPASLAITLSVNPEANTVIELTSLTVWWKSGAEHLLLFTYSPSTADYIVATPLASARATITNVGGVFSIAIQSTEALRVENETLYVNLLDAPGVAPTSEPRLLFYHATRPMATLTKSGGLYVPSAQQVVPVDQRGQFLLGDGAAINRQGVLAETFEQPI